MDHITEDHPDEDEEGDDSSEGEAADDSSEEVPEGVRVRPTNEGDLVSTTIEGGDLVVRVNISNPLLEDLKEGIRGLGEDEDD